MNYSLFMKFKVNAYISPNIFYGNPAKLWLFFALNILLISTPMKTTASEKFNWMIASPESKGLDSKSLKKLDQELKKGDHGYVDSFIVIKNNVIVFEEYYEIDYGDLTEKRFGEQNNIMEQNYGQNANPIYNYYDSGWHPYYKETDLHTIQSVTKSVTSALIGIAIDEGFIPSIDQEIIEYFPEHVSLFDEARKEAITIRDLLTMTAGIKWDEDSYDYTDPLNDAANMENSEDWLDYILSKPMEYEPGQNFVYNSGITIILSHILEQTTGLSAENFAVKYLLEPLEIKDFFWKKTPKNLTDTESGLYLSSRDFAKIGLLYLNNGMWNNRQIVPEDWINQTVTPAIETGFSNGNAYGFQWWLHKYEKGSDKIMYCGSGYGGQYLLIFPEYDLVAVFTGWNVFDVERPAKEYLASRILNALK